MTRPRVGFELTGLALDATGAARAIGALRDALQRRGDLEMVGLAQPRGGSPALGSTALRGLVRELAWFPLALPAQARRLGLDLLHCPVGLAPVWPSIPTVVTVNDAMALRHPEWFTRANGVHARLVLGRALRAATRVLVPSEHAARDVADAFGVEADRIDVTPYGVDGRFAPGPPQDGLLASLGVRRPYVLLVGTLQPRKNVEAALAAFESLHADGAPHALVLVGARGWLDDPQAGALRRSPARERIVLTGRVGEDELVALYRGASALVYPSRYEGFGFPPLEAMACGTPVVCSDRTSLPELVGDGALLVDPDDSVALRAALERALDPTEAADLRARGLARAATFTWAGCAALTVAAYRRALGSAGQGRC